MNMLNDFLDTVDGKKWLAGYAVTQAAKSKQATEVPPDEPSEPTEVTKKKSKK